MTAPTLPTTPRPTPWLTIVGYRRPNQKLHMNRGHAINALKFHGEGTMWRAEGDEWKHVATAVTEIRPHPKYGFDQEHTVLHWQDGEQ